MPRFDFLIHNKSFSTKQHEGIKNNIPKFIEIVNPERIVEIGSYNFGFTAFLAEIFSKEILTYEIVVDLKRKYQDLLDANITNVTAKFLDIFSDKEFIYNYIQQEGKTLVFCDGGNKIEEFKFLSPFLKPGDIICAHDFKETSWEGNRPEWPIEITNLDIEEAINDNNLTLFQENLMLPIVWGSYIKGETGEQRISI